MNIELSLHAKDGTRHDLVVTGHPSTTWGHTLAAYVRPPLALFKGDERVDLGSAIGSGAIASGDILSVGEPLHAEGWALDGPGVLVVGGADSGRIVAAEPGAATSLGRANDNGIVVADPTVSSHHAELTIDGDGAARVVDSGSSNGTIVSGVRLRPGTSAFVRAGERFAAGEATLMVSGPVKPDGSVQVSEEGESQFNRVIRYPFIHERQRFSVPSIPGTDDALSAMPQYVGSVTMLVTGVASAFVFHNVLFALLGLLGPLALLGTTALVQRRTKQRDRRQRTEMEDRQRQVLADIASAASAELDIAWESTLDPARCALAAQGPTSDLWSSDAMDAQALTLRVGTVDRLADIDIAGANDAIQVPTLMSAPVTVDLRTFPVLGIAGPEEAVQGVARALVLQAAASRSPDDLLIVHLGAESGPNRWSWLRWLPHVHPGADAVHTVSPTPDSLKARFDELTALQRQRLVLDGVAGPGTVLLPEVLVVLDGAGALRGRPSAVKLLQDASRTGIRVIALDTHPSRLPAEASARLVIDPPRASLEVKGGSTTKAFTPDQVSVAVCERTARAMAGLTPLGAAGVGGLPRSVRFVDLAGLDGARDSQVRLRWSEGAEGQATLGVDEHGNTVSVDLGTDGPHALIAGTSGSGKSELLRSLVASLAINASPTDLGLLLIDFKGGGAFGKLAYLPHVVGYADDLSIGGVLANRLIDSLKAELEYRKTKFKEAGNVEGLPEYRKARAHAGGDLEAIARLVIVVDEFAELKEAQPEFVDSLVNVARVGRSLGVHLVLATQQPAGVVTPQIRDNANLRICLRVLDPGTSLDIVRSPLAATFSNRDKGRAILVSGDTPPLPFQAAYVSAPRRNAAADEVPPPTVREVPWEQCGSGTPGVVRAEAGIDDDSDLADLVSLLRDTAKNLGLAPSRRPWLPPIPERIDLRQVASPDGSPGVAYGIVDNPRRQRHDRLTFRLGEGNLGIAGGRASGRSTALRTLAAALAQRFDADSLHLYVIDQSPTSSLRPLAQLPHCGVVATRSDRYVTERLVARLKQELAARSEMLGRTGFASMREVAQSSQPVPPWVVLMVDGWDSLASTETDSLREELVRLAEEGPALGIQVAVAGGKGLSTSRILSSFAEFLVLGFDQRDDMSAFGVPIRMLPAELPPGRAFRPGSSDAVQIAVLDGSGPSDEQNAALREIASALHPPIRHHPMRLSELPSRISLAEAEGLQDVAALPPRAFIAAVGGDALDVRVADLDQLETPFVVAGPPGSGRTQALALIAHQLRARGVPVHAWNVSPKDKPLFPDRVVLAAPPPLPLEAGAVALVDDADAFDAEDETISTVWGQKDAALVLAGDPSGLTGFSGWKARMRSGATGLLLSPQFRGGDVIGATIGIEESFTGAPGRAYLGSRGRLELVQIPIVDPGPTAPRR